MNKKGDLASLFWFLLLIFGFAVLVIIFSNPFLEIVGDLKESSSFGNNTDAVGTMELVEANTIPLMDYAIFFLFLGFVIGMILLSIYINPTPAVLIVYILGFVILLVLSGLMANAFNDITSDASLVGTASQFTLTTAILGERFPLIILGVGAIVGIILYSRNKSQGIQV